ncbi:MAG: HAMP domain-containing histidine kinase [Candidatus Magnetominusculus sp. LBB02]|nr:HAMP domain-containing histidine kinase [Candidatus Magnetominusculus sp. LBB02]
MKVSDEEMRNEDKLIQQSKMATLGEMLIAISHQWMQPLNAISLIAEDLKDAHKYGERDEKYLDNAVKNIMLQVVHMSETAKVFKSFSKPSGNTLFDVRPAIEETISLVHDQFMKEAINIQFDCRYDTQFMVLGKINEFKQAVLNILANAKDAIIHSRKEGKLNPDEEGFILISLDKTDSNAIIEILDTNSGIPENIIDRIFEPYFTTKGCDGTGIGLYMTKLIIEEHLGGRITASNVAKQAVFRIELPINE